MNLTSFDRFLAAFPTCVTRCSLPRSSREKIGNFNPGMRVANLSLRDTAVRKIYFLSFDVKKFS